MIVALISIKLQLHEDVWLWCIFIHRLKQVTDQYNAELSSRDQEIEQMKTRYWPPF